ncbi:RloB family protein [Treponema primitia]|uniref:RloB family protein n=1 Tax=Treponema primitia TaxID=88058 RepID=UPI000255561D|nr:RloB family protein [Treponema primitia]
MGHDKLFQKRAAELRRAESTRQPRIILIVCEGEKTEPNYFKAFPENPRVYDEIDIQGTGYNTISLVKKATELKSEAQKKHQPYQEVWCVFDRDSFPLESFNEALALARRENIRCAYSNEAFEIWYLLHFNYCDTAFSRTQYKEKLTDALGTKYLKNDLKMYERLQDKQETAIRNANKLYTIQCTKATKDQNPVTTVFELVEKLRY